LINFEQFFNFVVNAKNMKTAKRKCTCYCSYKLETYRPTCTLCSQLTGISGFQPITQTNNWCHIFGQKSSTRFVHNVAAFNLTCKLVMFTCPKC